MVKFIHTADWQIGKQFSSIQGDVSAYLREQRFNLIKRIAQYANEYEADAILVAGDVFDANEVSDTTLRKALNQMQAFAGPWVLLPGNHDPALDYSVWTRMQGLSEKTDPIILATEPEPIVVANDELVILPAPSKQKAEYRDLTEWFDTYQVEANQFKVGLAHGSLSGWVPESDSPSNVIDNERVQKANLDYLALGDWHGQKHANWRTWYSGTPEQDSFQEYEPGKSLLVELGAGHEPSVTPFNTGLYHWYQLEFKLYEANDIHSIDERLNQFDQPEYHIIRLYLQGHLSLSKQSELQEILAKWRACFCYFEVIDDHLNRAPDEEDWQHLASQGVVYQAFQRLNEIHEDASHPQHAYAERAMAILWQNIQS